MKIRLPTFVLARAGERWGDVAVAVSCHRKRYHMRACVCLNQVHLLLKPKRTEVPLEQDASVAEDTALKQLVQLDTPAATLLLDICKAVLHTSSPQSSSSLWISLTRR